ncbi:MAG: hypothetical protein QF685_12905 [Verrucomicrobiota bacterium]|jgi:hypothetical protein|nr:hypothetical protein [Verrucomicrobiota bacterium]
MSEEQDNQMEQWLEEYAQRRRNELDGPIEMHEATRTMLQGEVSRVYPKSVETQPQPRESSAWMVWAIGGATVGVAAIVITLKSSLPQGNPSMEMVKADGAKPAAAVESGQAGELAKASVDSVPKFKETGKTQTATIRNIEEGNSRARRITPTGNKDNPGALSIVEVNPGGAPTETTQAATSNSIKSKKAHAGGFAPGPINTPKRDRAFYNNIHDLRQDFTQSNLQVANRKNVLPEAVLVDFQVERTGNQVRVIDQDGSVYTGNVINEERYSSVTGDKAIPSKQLSAATAKRGIANAPEAPIAVVQTQRNRAVSRGQFYFRVQGLNRTLGKAVVLEATLDSPPDKPVAPMKPIALSFAKGRAEQEAKLSAPAEKAQELGVQKLQAIRAIARMRILGNARIEKANYAVDAYIQQQPVLPSKALIKPTQARDK